jgi:hypothetical protein
METEKENNNKKNSFNVLLYAHIILFYTGFSEIHLRKNKQKRIMLDYQVIYAENCNMFAAQ